MNEKPISPKSAENQDTDDGDPDSPGQLSLFARLFGRSETGGEEHSEKSGSDSAAEETLRNQDMLVNLRNMRTLNVNDVSVPRADIVGVSGEATVDEVLDVFRSSTWSRLPVFTDNLDQPIGLIHLKDFALKYGFGASAKGFSAKDLVRPLLYVPPSMPIGVLLHKMQIARIHMALVIDEYGGVDGLVTIEDLLEQIVGEIADEHDEDEIDLWVEEGPDVFVAAARMDLDAFKTKTGLRLTSTDRDEDVDTLGGIVFQLAGRVPERGEIVIHDDGHEFEILEGDARRIKRLRVRLKIGPQDNQLSQAAE